MDHAVKAVIIRNGTFLLLKQKVEGKIFYALPGGRIHTDHFEQELQREVLEETGLTISVDSFLGEWSFTRRNGQQTHCRVYACTPSTEHVSAEKSEDREEIQEFLWLTLSDLEKSSIPLDHDLILLIQKAFSG